MLWIKPAVTEVQPVNLFSSWATLSTVSWGKPWISTSAFAGGTGQVQGELCRLPWAHRPKSLEALHLNLLPQKLDQKVAVAPKVFHLTAFTGVSG